MPSPEETGLPKGQPEDFAPDLWAFDLTPTPHPDHLPERLGRVAQAAAAHGLKIARVHVELEDAAPGPSCPTEIKIRKWLKDALRRCGLRAKWPTPEPPTDPENT